MKKLITLLCCLSLVLALLAGCGSSAPAVPAATEVPTATVEPTEEPVPEVTEEPAPVCPLEDGTYLAIFDTDSSMFHVNETMNGQGILTVKNGKMSIDITLASTGILNLYLGTAEDAEKDETNWLPATCVDVDYPDGTTDAANSFTVPVPYLDDEFDCALIGKKGVWYDHKVSVSNPQPVQVTDAFISADLDGKTCEVTLVGGTGKTTVESPAALSMVDGELCATVVLSSTKYTYMLVNGVQYDNVAAPGEKSTFVIPVELDVDMAVSAETVAMSEPHLIDYTLHFDSATMK